MSPSGSTGLGAGLWSQRWRTGLVQSLVFCYMDEFGASLALLSSQSRVLLLSSGLKRYMYAEGDLERVDLAP